MNPTQTPHAVFAQSWHLLCETLKVEPALELRDTLLTAYAEPQRHYHTQQHLLECLQLMQQLRHLATNPVAVEMALWFHDAIYEVRGSDNEQKSADWALQALAELGATAQFSQQVATLILATQHQQAPSDADAQLLVDIDLAILAASPERFAQYNQQIRAEYQHVPRWLYQLKRRQVLGSFLKRTSIFSTPYFRQHFEHKARLNLASVC